MLDFSTRWGWLVSVTSRPHFSPGERTPGTHCTGGWVGPRAGLGTEARGKILLPLPGIETLPPGRPACSETLYWLSYPAHKTINYYDDLCGNNGQINVIEKINLHHPEIWDLKYLHSEVTSQTSNLELNGSDAWYCNIEPAGELIHCKAQLIKANKIHSISLKWQTLEWTAWVPFSRRVRG
jgi:hypothetical protein